MCAKKSPAYAGLVASPNGGRTRVKSQGRDDGRNRGFPLADYCFNAHLKRFRQGPSISPLDTVELPGVKVKLLEPILAAPASAEMRGAS
jgi:hypothetical protein